MPTKPLRTKYWKVDAARTTRDWRALRRSLFMVSLIIATLLGLNTAFLGWTEYANQLAANKRSILNFSNQVNASLDNIQYGTATELVDAFLKRQDVLGIAVYDRYNFEVTRQGLSPRIAADDSKYMIYNTRLGDDQSYSIIVMKKPDYAALIRAAIFQSAVTFLVAFVILRLILGDIVQRYFAKPLVKLGDAMNQTKQTGAHVEVKMATDTEIGRLAAIFNDMQRESARRNEELKLALKKADSANKAKSAFLANMSHELRSPLNAIIGFSQMLVHRDTLITKNQEQKITDYASSIESGGKHLLEIVNTVLDLKRIEQGISSISQTLIPARELLDEIIVLIDVGECNNWLETEHIIEDGDGMVYADYTVLKQVLINFVCNAQNHNPEGTKVRVSIATSQSKSTIVVADEGVGMSEEDVEFAIQPFARLSNPMVADSGGSGLGLPISRSLILQHGGTFRIESELKKGTAIYFTLPGPEEAKNREEKSGELPEVDEKQKENMKDHAA